jgi:hypothetical protein
MHTIDMAAASPPSTHRWRLKEDAVLFNPAQSRCVKVGQFKAAEHRNCQPIARPDQCLLDVKVFASRPQLKYQSRTCDLSKVRRGAVGSGGGLAAFNALERRCGYWAGSEVSGNCGLNRAK